MLSMFTSLILLETVFRNPQLPQLVTLAYFLNISPIRIVGDQISLISFIFINCLNELYRFQSDKMQSNRLTRKLIVMIYELLIVD